MGDAIACNYDMLNHPMCHPLYNCRQAYILTLCISTRTTSFETLKFPTTPVHQGVDQQYSGKENQIPSLGDDE